MILKNKVELPMSENGYKNIQKRFDGEDICNIDLNWEEKIYYVFIL